MAEIGRINKLKIKRKRDYGAHLDGGASDKQTNRITASSKLDKFLGLQPPRYDEGQEVDLFICEKSVKKHSKRPSAPSTRKD